MGGAAGGLLQKPLTARKLSETYRTTALNVSKCHAIFSMAEVPNRLKIEGMTHGHLLNRRGFTLVESLVAVGIIGVGLMALPVIMQQVSGSTRKGKAFSQALALEASILAALQNEATFESHRSTMASGARPDGLAIAVNGTEFARVGQPRFFNLAGKPCAALDQKECVLKVDFDIKCTPGTPYALCDAAYRISAHSQAKGAQPMGPLGASGSTGFSASDYFVPIPAEHYLRMDSTACDPATTVAISGFNRDTGEAYCISKPQNRCPEGTIAKKVQFISNPSGRGGRFEFQCTTTFQTLTCPANYALMTFSPASLEPGKTKSGTCVFVGVNSVPWQTSPTGKTISGTFCPVNYKTVGASCGAIGATSSPGTCYDPCNCVPPSPPDPVTGVSSPGGCDSCPRSVAAAVGSCGVTHQGDQTASCSISYPSQQCGATWDANCQMSGSCERVPAETVPAS